MAGRQHLLGGLRRADVALGLHPAWLVTSFSAAANGSPSRGGYSDVGMIVKKSK